MFSAANKYTRKQNLEADLSSLSLVPQLKTVLMNTALSLSVRHHLLCTDFGLVPNGCCLMILRWLLPLQALLLLSRHKNGKGLILLKLCVFIPGVLSSLAGF